MPPRESKAQIVKRLETERRRLEQNLARLRREDMLKPGVVGRSSVKDVLAHLADWEAHMLVWVKSARGGDPVETPEPGLTWKQLDVMNRRIYEAHCHQSLEDVQAYFADTHTQFMDMVRAMPEEEMLARGRYSFMGGDAIYKWLNGYAAHDLWGKTKIREWMQAHQKLKKTSGPHRRQ